jgi:hypothetical protein
MLFDFGEPTGDMGMLWLEFEDPVKSGPRFVKLSLHQARVSLYKGIVCGIFISPLGWHAQGVRMPPTPTSPGDPSCAHSND